MRRLLLGLGALGLSSAKALRFRREALRGDLRNAGESAVANLIPGGADSRSFLLTRSYAKEADSESESRVRKRKARDSEDEDSKKKHKKKKKGKKSEAGSETHGKKHKKHKKPKKSKKHSKKSKDDDRSRSEDRD